MSVKVNVAGEAIFKKKNGIITVDLNELTWTLAGSSSPSLKVPMIDIKGLQVKNQAERNFIRIAVPSPDSESNKFMTFTFDSYATFDTIKAAIQKSQAECVSNQPKKPTPSVNTSQSSEKKPIEDRNRLLSDKYLLKDEELQRKILNDSKSLQRSFKEIVILGGLSSEEFWSTRLSLLRQNALFNFQKRGPYNVMSKIRIMTEGDNKINLSVTREQIKEIFEQYPIVKRAYNENVPPLSESDFWARFFMSRLFRKLRGEKYTNQQPDGLLDKYLNMSIDDDDDENNENSNSSKSSQYQVSKFIDIEGNEEDNPEKQGNLPDFTMKPDAIPSSLNTLRSLNLLSKKLLKNVNKDGSTDPETIDDMEKELALKDLEPETEQDRIMLHLRDLTKKVGASNSILDNKDKDLDINNANNYKDLTNDKVEEYVKGALKKKFNLREFTINENNNINEAFTTVNEMIEKRHTEIDVDEKDPIPFNFMQQMMLSHSTASEFLQHFWMNFQSGDPAKAPLLTNIVESLVKSQGRVNNIINKANQPEKQKIEQCLEPLRKSLSLAIATYHKAVNSSINS